MIPDFSKLICDADLADLADLAAALRRAEVELTIRLNRSLTARLADPNADEVLSLGEVAQLLRLHPDTVRKMAKRGDIPTVALGKRSVGVRREAFKQWTLARERRTFRAA